MELWAAGGRGPPPRCSFAIVNSVLYCLHTYTRTLLGLVCLLFIWLSATMQLVAQKYSPRKAGY